MLEGVSAVKDHFILLMKTTVVAWFSQSTWAIPCFNAVSFVAS